MPKLSHSSPLPLSPASRPAENTASPSADHAVPTAVSIDDAKQTLGLTWADGHSTTLAYAYLRGLCPCAVCQGHGGDLVFVEPDAPSALSVGDVLEVGHYALNVVWQDGHRTGIYALTYLRSLCPCAPCRERLGAAHAIHRVPAARVANIVGAALQPTGPA